MLEFVAFLSIAFAPIVSLRSYICPDFWAKSDISKQKWRHQHSINQPKVTPYRYPTAEPNVKMPKVGCLTVSVWTGREATEFLLSVFGRACE